MKYLIFGILILIMTIGVSLSDDYYGIPVPDRNLRGIYGGGNHLDLSWYYPGGYNSGEVIIYGRNYNYGYNRYYYNPYDPYSNSMIPAYFNYNTPVYYPGFY